MKFKEFPKEIQPYLYPEPNGVLVYTSLHCGKEFDISRLLYTCPECGNVLLLEDKNSSALDKLSGTEGCSTTLH